MSDEHSAGIRIAGEQPPIPVGTAVNLSAPPSYGFGVPKGPRGEKRPADVIGAARPSSRCVSEESEYSSITRRSDAEPGKVQRRWP